MPKSDIWNIGASSSLLIAIMYLESFIPTWCCVAPEMPHAIYISGLTVLPVWPTCCEQGTQPASTIALVAPTAAFSLLAKSLTKDKFSASPSPLPAETTIEESSS